jgi:hypothetical protein
LLPADMDVALLDSFSGVFSFFPFGLHFRPTT